MLHLPQRLIEKRRAIPGTDGNRDVHTREGSLF
jgi:hypothetical protein